jgi:translation initiation factor 2B subunit (eIF-2B alpha/beta/delta family)
MTLPTYAILPATQAEVEVERQAAEQYLQMLESGTIDTPEDEKMVASVMATAHQRHKRLEELRLETGKPARDLQQAINDHFRGALTTWAKAKAKARDLLAEAERERRAEAQAAMEAARPEAIPAPVEKPKEIRYHDELEIKVIDFDAVPREYLTVDWSAVRLAYASGKTVPGMSAELVRRPVLTGR